MRYSNIKEAIFVSRPNRFVAKVVVDDVEENVHVKNTGRCSELLIPGVKVFLVKSDNESRKTKYDLVAVEREGYGIINIDSQAPNHVVKEWLESNESCFDGITYIKPEYTIGESRIDFYFEQGDVKNLIEVKGCTLLDKGTGFFPDAPTDRGVKHLYELIEAKRNGYNAGILFVIQANDIDVVIPNRKMHPEFADAIRDAVKAGVNLIFLSCAVSEDLLCYKDYKIISNL